MSIKPVAFAVDISPPPYRLKTVREAPPTWGLSGEPEWSATPWPEVSGYIENPFAKLKAFRRIATRYDKLHATFAAMLSLACFSSGSNPNTYFKDTP